MNVLSLFDGMSCGQIALNKLGINYDKYFACEIDKYAMQVTQHNFPDTIQLGDVQFVTKETFGTNKIDLLMGGSPCQGFSFAGKQLNFDDPRSALFFEFVRLVKELKPKYFLLENVVMKQEYQDVISKYMGCEPIRINSALVSAQTRKRLYWTNIPGIGQPEDKGIVLRDIIEKGDSCDMVINQGKELHKEDIDKSHCLLARDYKGFPNQPFTGVRVEQVGDKLRHPEATKKGYAEAGEGEGLDLTFPDSKTRRGRSMKDKSNCLTAASQEMGVVIDPSKPNQINPNKSAKSSSEDEKGTQPHMQDRVFHEDGKSHSLTASFASRTKVGKFEEDKELRPATIVGRRLNDRGVREDYNKDVPITQCLQVKHNSDKSGTLTTVEKDNVLSENEPGRYPNAYENKKLSWRKLTPLECERLQTVPDKVFLVNFEICIDQAKNFVSAVNKNPKLQKLVSNAEREELLEYVKLARENTRRRNPKIKPIAHQNVGTLTQMQIRECIKTSLKGLNTNAKDAESCATSKNPIIEVGSVDWNVSTIITDGKTIGLGKGASPLKDNLSVRVKSGKNALSISGIEMTQLAEDVEKGLNTKTVSNSTSIMLSLFSTKSIEQMLIIYYLFAENVIDGYIPKETRKENTYLPLIIFEGYTSVVSNSQRYKMLGNGWTVDVITHILKNMEL